MNPKNCQFSILAQGELAGTQNRPRSLGKRHARLPIRSLCKMCIHSCKSLLLVNRVQAWHCSFHRLVESQA